MGIYNVQIDNALFTQPISAKRNITTTKALESSSNVLNKIDLEPLTFTLILTPLDKSFTDELISKIYQWFDVSDYAKLSFEDNPNFYYNVIPFLNQSEVQLHVQNKGYFEVEFTADAGHGYIDIIHNVDCGDGDTIILISNSSDVKTNDSYSVPLFLSLSSSSYLDFTVQINNDENNVFSFSHPTCKTIDIDAKNGLIISNENNSDNLYKFATNIQSLYLPKQGINSIKVKNNNKIGTISGFIGISCPSISGVLVK